MTSETRTLIELSDITGVEITCSGCGYGAYYPIAKFTELESFCPQCKIAWFDEVSSRYNLAQSEMVRYPAVASLLALTSELRALTRKDRTDLHAKIRFRVATV